MSARLALAANRQRAIIWIAVGAGVAVLLAANAHLVYVATTSQPECVAHARTGEANGQQFSAAKSSCSPG